MEVSPLLARLSTLTLDALFATTKANLRVHGEHHIPRGPVLYVINHFTRIETVFLPYIIYKKTGRFPLSLADHSFFSGSLGRMLSRFGAVSTRDPGRDKILMGALISGRHPVIIFPEGQMLKDKKLIEKGKYMVYNTGIRRPPHTGAANLALRSQFYREKIRMLRARGKREEAEAILRHFDIPVSDMDTICGEDTQVVPVNITYYPIRARENAISRFLENLLKKVPERLEEELEVEGTMLLKGVDIDIRFGNPIKTVPYLFSSSKTRRGMKDENLYTGETRPPLPERTSLAMMYRYMDAIYSMTTVNHDHVFSWLLSSWPGKTITEKDFRNRAYLAIEKIQKTGIAHYHSCLFRTQYHLITDDEHRRYASFINAVRDDGLITIQNGQIVKNTGRFTVPYSFHTVRRDNIVEVYKNEIEPMGRVIRILRMSAVTHRFFMRRHLRRQFLRFDRELFLQDYKRYYIPGESKSREIGQPVFLRHLFSRRGVILVHGYLSAPEEIRPLADYLYKKGYTVYLPRLRGHGTAPEDLAVRTWREWYHSVSRAYIIMDNTVKNLSICGFSTGAAIALLQSSHKGSRFRCVISINAPLHLRSIASRFTKALTAWNTLLKKMDIRTGRKEYVTNTPENPHINYFRNPISGVRELDLLMKELTSRLGEIHTPALIIQGTDDPVVNPESAREILKGLKSTTKSLVSIPAHKHGILRGDAAPAVMREVHAFLTRMDK